MGWFDEGTKRQRRHRVVLLIFIVAVATALWGRFRPLPDGLSAVSPVYNLPVNDVTIYFDVTGVDASGQRFVRQEIFDEVLRLIAGANRFVVLDFFLFNQFGRNGGSSHRDVTEELTAALVAKRRANPQVAITFITDPINTVYGGRRSLELERLQQAGVTVVSTDLTKIRDGNPWYSGPWRISARWFGNAPDGTLVPNPFQPNERVSVRSWLALMNLKANHRKVVVADRGSDVVSLVTSLNPHTGSSAHGNVAVEFVNGPWRELVASEQAAASFSGRPFSPDVSGFHPSATATATSTLAVQTVTESKIARVIEQQLAATGAGDQVDVLAFYLADRRVIQALVDAAQRGAWVRVILDPNKDAFGRTKDGLPNRPVGVELMLHSGTQLSVRWSDTHGEQAHAKMIAVRRKNGNAFLIAGSANFTKRNLRDLNLETDVAVSGSSGTPFFQRATEFFDTLWLNRGGNRYTTEYAAYRDESLWKSLRYRFMEWSGLSSW